MAEVMRYSPLNWLPSPIRLMTFPGLICGIADGAAASREAVVQAGQQFGQDLAQRVGKPVGLIEMVFEAFSPRMVLRSPSPG